MSEQELNGKVCMHQGQNIARWRVTLGLTQEQLAERMKLSQNRISQIENTEFISENILSDVAKALGVTIDILKAYDHNANMCNYITYITTNNNTNSVNEVQDGGTGVVNSQSQVINPLEKVSELYERLLQMQEENFYLKLNAENLSVKKEN